MKVSELADYKDDKPTKTGLKAKDRIIYIPTGREHIIAHFHDSYYAAINLHTGHARSVPRKKLSSEFTKADIKEMLGNLDDWEVKE